eukprot:g2951.t1
MGCVFSKHHRKVILPIRECIKKDEVIIKESISRTTYLEEIESKILLAKEHEKQNIPEYEQLQKLKQKWKASIDSSLQLLREKTDYCRGLFDELDVRNVISIGVDGVAKALQNCDDLVFSPESEEQEVIVEAKAVQSQLATIAVNIALKSLDLSELRAAVKIANVSQLGNGVAVQQLKVRLGELQSIYSLAQQYKASMKLVNPSLMKSTSSDGLEIKDGDTEDYSHFNALFTDAIADLQTEKEYDLDRLDALRVNLQKLQTCLNDVVKNCTNIDEGILDMKFKFIEKARNCITLITEEILKDSIEECNRQIDMNTNDIEYWHSLVDQSCVVDGKARTLLAYEGNGRFISLNGQYKACGKRYGRDIWASERGGRIWWEPVGNKWLWVSMSGEVMASALSKSDSPPLDGSWMEGKESKNSNAKNGKIPSLIVINKELRHAARLVVDLQSSLNTVETICGKEMSIGTIQLCQAAHTCITRIYTEAIKKGCAMQDVDFLEFLVNTSVQQLQLDDSDEVHQAKTMLKKLYLKKIENSLEEFKIALLDPEHNFFETTIGNGMRRGSCQVNGFMTEETTRALQLFLQRMGYNVGQINGKPSQSTVAMLNSFLREKGYGAYFPQKNVASKVCKNALQKYLADEGFNVDHKASFPAPKNIAKKMGGGFTFEAGLTQQLQFFLCSRSAYICLEDKEKHFLIVCDAGNEELNGVYTRGGKVNGVYSWVSKSNCCIQRSFAKSDKSRCWKWYNAQKVCICLVRSNKGVPPLYGWTDVKGRLTLPPPQLHWNKRTVTESTNIYSMIKTYGNRIVKALKFGEKDDQMVKKVDELSKIGFEAILDLMEKAVDQAIELRDQKALDLLLVTLRGYRKQFKNKQLLKDQEKLFERIRQFKLSAEFKPTVMKIARQPSTDDVVVKNMALPENLDYELKRTMLYKNSTVLACPLCEQNDNKKPSVQCWMCNGTGKVSKLLEAVEPPEDCEIECEICFCDSIFCGISTECKHFFCKECIGMTLQRILESGQFPAFCPTCRAETKKGEAIKRGKITDKALTFLERRGVITKEFQFRFMKNQNESMLVCFPCPSETCDRILVQSKIKTVGEKIVQGKTGPMIRVIKQLVGQCVCGQLLCIECHTKLDEKTAKTHDCTGNKGAEMDEATKKAMQKIGKPVSHFTLFLYFKFQVNFIF